MYYHYSVMFPTQTVGDNWYELKLMHATPMSSTELDRNNITANFINVVINISL